VIENDPFKFRAQRNNSPRACPRDAGRALIGQVRQPVLKQDENDKAHGYLD
jgi:hypothetical protein